MSEIRKNLGGVTAYAYAKSKGYTGTEEEFAQLMANYATVGQTATEAAEQATTKAGEASASATNAASSATAASASATAAAGSASAAASSESNAAASATAASGSATQAATSATAAQAAQAAAEAVLESIPEDYSQLDADVTDLKSRLVPIELIDFASYSGDISVEVGKYVNYSGVRGDAAWNKLYTLTPESGQVVKITAYASLNAVPAFWYNGVAYPPSAQSGSAEYSGYIIGDGTSLLRVNSGVSSGTEVQPPDILVDAHATMADLDAVETDVSKIVTGQKLLFTDVTANKNNNRYINFSGVCGDISWNNMYNFVPQYGVQYAITTRTAASLPAFYYKAPYPSAAQSAEYSYTGYIVGDGVTSCYVNCIKDANGNEIQPVDIKITKYAPDETRQKADALAMISNNEHGTHITTIDTPNRFILNNYVRGTLDGYTLKEFTTSVDAVYLIYSEIEASRAGRNLPNALCNGIAYGNKTGKGYYIVIGNGEKCYVNSLSTATTIIDQYCFNAFVDRIPNVFRMFENCVCCGDSLTYSQVWNSSSSQRQALVPYPKAVEKITGTTTDILAVAGYTCENWWTAFNAQITGSKKLYLIYLGTNDTNMTDTVSTDCVGDDPSQYANTPCGYYGRIIKTIQNTDSKCILIKVALGSSGNARNDAITSLGTRFGVPVVNNPQYILNDLYYHYGDDGEYYNTIHLNDVGYEAFAEYIVKAVNALPLATKYALMP